MMFGWARFARLANDLIHEPTAPMTAVANSAWNSAQQRFKSDAQRIREKDRDIKSDLLPEQPNNAKKRSVWQRNDRVHFLNEGPHRRDFRRRSDCDVSVWTAIFDSAHRWHTHHRVAQPIAGTDENSEWLQITSRKHGRQINTASVVREKKIRVWRFPTI